MTGPELAARARALIPMLAENAAEAEKQRKPVDAVITALEEAEIYKLMVPQLGWIVYDPRLHEDVLESGEPVRFGKGDITSCFFYCIGRSHELHVWKLP